MKNRRNDARDEAAFVADLLSRMTPAEKVGQLNLLSAGEGPETGSPNVRDIRARLDEGRLGGLFGAKSVASVRAWQELAIAGVQQQIRHLQQSFIQTRRQHDHGFLGAHRGFKAHHRAQGVPRL